MKSCFVNKTSNVTQYSMPLYHTHHFYELYLLADGVRTIYVENEEYAMEKGDLLLIPHDVLHRTEGEKFTRYLVNFTPEYLDEEQTRLVEFFKRQHISLTQEETGTVLALLEKMLSMQNGGNLEVEPQRAYDFRVCFSYLLFFLSECRDFPKTQYTAQKTYNARTKKIINYIHKHYDEKITLDSLSKMFFLSKPALCADFKKNTNMSIIDYLLKTRIKNAQLLLEHSDKPLSNIARLCGFSSQKYFYLMFSKLVGVAPREYRKRLRISSSTSL